MNHPSQFSAVSYQGTISHVVQVVEAVGVVVMVVGAMWALASGIPAARRADDRQGVYEQVRRNLGRVILLGLEILIIGDIVRTVAVEPTLAGVLVLGIIVVIRIVLSFAIEVEIGGRWPWQTPGRSTPPPTPVTPAQRRTSDT